MRVGVLEVLIGDAGREPLRHFSTRRLNRHYASIMPQAVSVWSRELGHETHYATYFGQADPKSLLPCGLDVVFLAAATSASSLAYALARLYRREGALVVLGGAHAKAFPDDALRFVDVAVGECDRTLVEELLKDRPRGVSISSGRPLRAVPPVEQRLPEIRVAHFDALAPIGGSGFVPLLASLGCPYACDFCSDWDSPYRLTPADQLEADLRFVSQHFPRARIPFHDPNFAVKFDRVLEVIERIPAERRNAYVIESSLSVLRDDDRLARLRDTRCDYIVPGIESWADYSRKSRVRASDSGRAKLEQVVAQLERIRAYVPGMQANFMFGVDSDRGREPVELTQEFIRRLPTVWPNLNVPTPFGGTPLYERHRAEGRILAAMPFAFYYTPYLVTTLQHYTAEEFYGLLGEIFETLISPRVVARRTQKLRGMHHLLHALQLTNARRLLREFRALRARLRGDAAFRAFHEGRAGDLPAFYRARFERLLGRYAGLLSWHELRPLLTPGRAASRRAQAGTELAEAV
jgi:radical SAM superfamily enzyme YgiQ (UPF0313 family)